jgi:hypothetical protein
MQTDLFGAPVRAVSVDQDALGFLIKFARTHRGQSFSSEQVTLSAIDAGVTFPDLRSWGSVFTKAAHDGHIRRSDVLFARSFGNGSLAPGWTGV